MVSRHADTRIAFFHPFKVLQTFVLLLCKSKVDGTMSNDDNLAEQHPDCSRTDFLRCRSLHSTQFSVSFQNAETSKRFEKDQLREFRKMLLGQGALKSLVSSTVHLLHVALCTN